MSKPFLDFDVSDFSNTNINKLSLAEIRRDSYTEGFIKGKEQGRTDAIDKLEKLREFYRKEQDYDASYGIGIAMEQLKENKK